jgi:dihydropteroate synthase
MFWKLPVKSIDLESTCYLAILNLTPDSFSDGGLYLKPESAIVHGKELLVQGAQIIDIGAESTRPGAQPVTPQEEWARIAPVIESLRYDYPSCTLSIDTLHPEVARLGLESGANVINDVTGFRDSEMLNLATHTDCGLIAMRARILNGSIWMPNYSDPSPKNASKAVEELEIVKKRLLDAGIAPERILLDPGFGFGTTFLEDQAIWDALPMLPTLLDWPVERFCIGISRKRFVAHKFGVEGNKMLDAKTAEMHDKAISIGYKVFRTHSLMSIFAA